MCISRVRPPATSVESTSGINASSSATFSARRLSKTASISPTTDTSIMGMSLKLISDTVESSASSGSSFWASVTFSRTRCKESSRSASTAKSMTITDTDSADEERISSTFFRSLKASSRGLVTRLSISPGDAPG